MKETNKFYNWFKNLGGDLKNVNIEKINNQLNENHLFTVSSFKTNPQQTKKKYNYKFTFNL